MIQIGGKTFLRPREIEREGLILNTKGKPDYGYVVRLIRNERLPAIVLNPQSKTPYYAVAIEDIVGWNRKFDPSYDIDLSKLKEVKHEGPNGTDRG